jgi:hypothetical protein
VVRIIKQVNIDKVKPSRFVGKSIDFLGTKEGIKETA